jgi:hypothetical protein
MTNTYQIQTTLVCTTQTDTAEKALDFLAMRLTTKLPNLPVDGRLDLTLDVDNLDYAMGVLSDCPNTFISEISQVTQLKPTPAQVRNFLDEHTIVKAITREKELNVSETLAYASENLAYEPTGVTKTSVAFDIRNKKTNCVTRIFQWDPDHLMELILKREPVDLSNFGATTIIQQFEEQNANRELKIDGQTIESISAFIEGKDFKNGINVVRPSDHILKITCYGQSVAHEYEVIAI